MDWGQLVAGGLIAVIGGVVGGGMAYYFRRRELRRQDRREVYTRFIRTVYEMPHRLMLADHADGNHIVRHEYVRDVNLIQAELELHANQRVIDNVEAYLERMNQEDVVKLFEGTLSAQEVLEGYFDRMNPILNFVLLSMRRDLGYRRARLADPGDIILMDY